VKFILVIVGFLVAVAAAFLLSSSMAGAQENVPNPQRNGNITIIATAYPDPDYDTLFDPDPNSISMSFSKENITFNVINEGIVKPTVSKLPTWFSINFDLEIPVDNSTTLITTASGIFNIYKVQEFPQVNEIIHFARGTLSIGEERWDTEAAFIVLPQQPFSGIVLQGYSD
jgi:hypothetical protein